MFTGNQDTSDNRAIIGDLIAYSGNREMCLCLRPQTRDLFSNEAWGQMEIEITRKFPRYHRASSSAAQQLMKYIGAYYL